MSDFASSVSLSAMAFRPVAAGTLTGLDIEYIDNGYVAYPRPEAAGKVGKWLGVIAAIAIPFAAPAIFGAIAGSGILGAGLASAATAGTLGTLTSVLGSAVVGGLLNAGVAYAGGARGGDVWRAAGVGALGAGLNAGISGVGGASNVTGGAGTNSLTGSAGIADTLGQPAILNGTIPGASATATLTAPTSSGGIMSSIRSIFGNISQDMARRVGAALVNAAVNGQSMGRLDGLVAQQRAELEALRQSDLAAYNQRISTAQQILTDADRMDPAWHARIAMADVAGMEANQFRQAMRNIAVRNGGSLDAGQQNAYERGAALHTARSKALAYNQRFGQAQQAQTQTRAQAAQLFTPNTAGMDAWRLGNELVAGQERARREADHSTWSGLTTAIFEQDYSPATSPDPSAEDEDNTFGGFVNGLRSPFGGG